MQTTFRGPESHDSGEGPRGPRYGPGPCIPVPPAAIVSTDGTNACTFLILKICERIRCKEDWSSNNEGFNKISV